MTMDADKEAPPGDRLRLLLVDDSMQTHATLRELLSSLGYQVVCARNGSEALSRFRTESIDVLVVDFHLAGTGGLHLMKEVYAVSPGVPVVLLSESNDSATIVRAMREGAVDLLGKSPNEAELLRALDRAGAFSRKERELHLEIQARQQAEAATHAKDELLANMSHELRTPMTAILGFAEAILLTGQERDGCPPQCAEAAQAIVRNGKHLLELINSILDLSKLEAGKQTIHKSKVSPAGIASDVIALLHDRAAGKGIGLRMTGKGLVPESICTDPTHLRQILINLCGNAVKFTEEGEVRLEISFTHSAGGGRLRFDVVDTGIGISAEQLSRLFKPFAQVESAGTQQYSGTGLGLAISKKLAQLMKGDITAASEPGAGSCFSLTIPIEPIDDDQLVDVDPTKTDPSQQENTGTVRSTPELSCRVLLAEDGVDNQRLISFILNKAGAEVTFAENGRQAVDLALGAWRRGRPFDVVLMDMQMPVLDGYQATQALRDEGYAGPIVALTAHALRGDREKCLQAGCTDYTTKPIDRKHLLTLVAALVDAQETAAS